jgi:uncharacterized protein YcbK (DUF882 family)
MNRRVFLGALLTVSLTPNAFAAKRQTHKILPKKPDRKSQQIVQRRSTLERSVPQRSARTETVERNETKCYLSLHHTHTDEHLEIAYRIGPEYDRGALRRLNYFLRDYRTDEVTFIDPRLYDLLFLMQRRVGNPDSSFEIVSAYRTFETNEELRRTSDRVAKNSLHLTGQALDIRLERTSTRNLRDVAIDLERGGVGYYPGRDFVHIDTGEVRRWGA